MTEPGCDDSCGLEGAGLRQVVDGTEIDGDDVFLLILASTQPAARLAAIVHTQTLAR